MRRIERMVRVTSLTLLVGVVLLLGCQRAPGRGMSPEQKVALRKDLVDWFECEECVSGEKDSVLMWGERAVPSLIAALEGGPSPAKREELRRYLEAGWDRLENYGRRRMESEYGATRESYVKLFLGNYEALYQARAADALGDIGTPAALDALRRARHYDIRADVRAAVDSALSR